MHVTVCICTRDRGESIGSTIRSLGASTHRDFDVVVVDQSATGNTEVAVRALMLAQDGLTYVRASLSGLSRARNTALEHARGPIVAFTDDDCEVDADWLHHLVTAFSQYPRVGQICGEVIPGPHDPLTGFIPDYRIPARRLLASPWLKWREGGIGANMAFRLDCLRDTGPFDSVLGAGGPLHSCEDGDMTYRLLRCGYHVLQLPEAVVIHHGFRTWAEGQRLMERTGMGVGAAYMKQVRLHDVAILPTLLVEWMRCISWIRLLTLRRRSGLRRFIGYMKGMVASFRYSIDARTRVYREPDSTVALLTGSSTSPAEQAASTLLN
jgi:glycosyltransferase involved in cell wall biosynthesis